MLGWVDCEVFPFGPVVVTEARRHTPASRCELTAQLIIRITAILKTYFLMVILSSLLA